MITLANERFRGLVSELGENIAATTPVSVDFVFDDVPARVTLHQNEREVIVDAAAFDASTYAGEERAELAIMLLRINSIGIRGRFMAIGVSPRGVVSAFTRTPLSSLDSEELREILGFLVEQARRLRAACDPAVLDDIPPYVLDTMPATEGTADTN
jgi:hypothetical protein